MVKKCLTVFAVVMVMLITTGCKIDGKPSWYDNDKGGHYNVAVCYDSTWVDTIRGRTAQAIDVYIDHTQRVERYRTDIFVRNMDNVFDGGSVQVYDAVKDTVWTARVKIWTRYMDTHPTIKLDMGEYSLYL